MSGPLTQWVYRPHGQRIRTTNPTDGGPVCLIFKEHPPLIDHIVLEKLKKKIKEIKSDRSECCALVWFGEFYLHPYKTLLHSPLQCRLYILLYSNRRSSLTVANDRAIESELRRKTQSVLSNRFCWSCWLLNFAVKDFSLKFGFETLELSNSKIAKPSEGSEDEIAYP